MNNLNISIVGEDYWLASRSIYAFTNNTYVDVWFTKDSYGRCVRSSIWDVSIEGKTRLWSVKAIGIRAVLYLTSKVKITGGDGTEGSPYVLE